MPQEGDYALDEVCHAGPSQFQGPTVHLHSNEPLGFRVRGAQLEAIAGSKHFELPPGRDYVWKHRLSESDQFMWNAMQVGMGAAEVIALPIGIPMILLGLGPRC